MAEKKFTPGPWEVDEVGAGELFVVQPDGDGGSWGICEMSKDGDWPNALLIAAAPDLYEALEACIEYATIATDNEWHVCRFCERSLPSDVIGPGPYDHRADCALFKARAALVKARGESMT